MKNINRQQGFTFAELVSVIAIIIVIVTASITGSMVLLDKARAAHIANDLKAIRAGWLQYAIDVGGTCTPQNDFNSLNSEFTCTDEPILTETHLFARISGNSTVAPPEWNGPYVSEEHTVDPWEFHYAYDADPGTTYDPDTGVDKFGGVNIHFQWCDTAARAQYLQILDEVDQILDHGDGQDLGDFRWDDSAYVYLLARDADAVCPN